MYYYSRYFFVSSVYILLIPLYSVKTLLQKCFDWLTFLKHSTDVKLVNTFCWGVWKNFCFWIFFGRKPGLVDSKLDSRSWVRILSHPILDGNGVKTMPDRLNYPILVHSIIEKKENTGSQMGHIVSWYFWKGSIIHYWKRVTHILFQ